MTSYVGATRLGLNDQTGRPTTARFATSWSPRTSQALNDQTGRPTTAYNAHAWPSGTSPRINEHIGRSTTGPRYVVYVGAHDEHDVRTEAIGYVAGELYGFSSLQDSDMEPIKPGETDDDKKTISFNIYTTAGLPASGISGEGAIVAPAPGEIQTNRDLAGYVNAAGTFAHIADGKYRYTFATAEVSGSDEGSIWFRLKVTGYRTYFVQVPLRYVGVDSISVTAAGTIRDAVLNAARSGHVTLGSIGEGVALAASLLQGNYFMDTVTNTANGQTAARLRCFHTGAATTAATAGGTGEGEFATFLVTTAYSGPNKVTTHRVVQQ